MNKKTIELNGNHYDAVSGKLLTNDTAPSVASAAPRLRSSGNNIDGFFRARTTAPARLVTQKISVLGGPQTAPKPSHTPQRHAPNHAKTHHAAVAPQPKRDVAAPAKLQVSKQATQHQVQINHTKAHQLQTSATLMRHAVKRPEVSLRKQANATGALAHTTPGLIEVKHTAAAIDTDRLVRAVGTTTSPMIAHHGKEVPRVSPLVAPLEVKAGPSSVPVPVKPQEHVPPTAPAPQPTNNPGGSPGKKQNIFDHALASATNYVDLEAHRAGYRKHARNHAVSMLAGLFALVVITAFATYQNSPGLQLRVASVQAGLSTAMPNLKAAGFAYTGAKAANGKLTVGFSNSGGNYSLTQQKTSWSGSDMIADIASVSASGTPNYTTVQDGGTTIYRFNNQTATWVADGKWYSISGTTGISNDQVKTIVESV